MLPIARNAICANRHGRGTPCIVDDQTVALIRIDLDRFDAKAVDKKLREYLGEKEGAAPWETHLNKSEQIVAELKQAGVHSVFLVLGAQDISTGPVLIIPKGGNERVQQMLQNALPKPHFESDRVVGDMLILGSAPAVERIAKMKPTERPELSKAWAAAADMDAQVLVMLTADMRRVLKEVSPLPEKLRTGPQADAMFSLEWAALGVKLVPHTEFKLVLQTTDEASAERTTELIGSALREASKAEQSLAKLASLIQVNRQGNQIVLAFQEKTPEAASAILNPIAAAREAARRTHCVNNFKQIAIAMHNFHDVNRRFPAAATYDANGKPLLSCACNYCLS